MKRVLLASAIALILIGCQRDATPPADPAPAAAPTETAPAAPDPAAVAADRADEAAMAEFQRTRQPAAVMAPEFVAKLQGILASPHRSEANRARDQYRHPLETLGFFGLAPGMTVIEINPGTGWYTEILGPALAGSGELVAAVVDPASATSDRAREYFTKANADLRTMLEAGATTLGPVQVVEYATSAPILGAPGSADMVVTFRNIHGWIRGGTEAAMFRAFFDVLKPGGVLGIEQHRAGEGSDVKAMADKGYVPEAHVIELARAAGFVLADQSEINANRADTRDHAGGVWNLPPSLEGHADEAAKEAARAIGESDRMTLRFVKPAAAPAAG